MNRLTWTVVLVVIATARLAGAQGAKVAKEFQRPSQGFAIVRKGHGPPHRPLGIEAPVTVRQHRSGVHELMA